MCFTQEALRQPTVAQRCEEIECNTKIVGKTEVVKKVFAARGLVKRRTVVTPVFIDVAIMIAGEGNEMIVSQSKGAEAAGKGEGGPVGCNKERGVRGCNNPGHALNLK